MVDVLRKKIDLFHLLNYYRRSLCTTWNTVSIKTIIMFDVSREILRISSALIIEADVLTGSRSLRSPNFSLSSLTFDGYFSFFGETAQRYCAHPHNVGNLGLTQHHVPALAYSEDPCQVKPQFEIILSTFRLMRD